MPRSPSPAADPARVRAMLAASAWRQDRARAVVPPPRAGSPGPAPPDDPVVAGWRPDPPPDPVGERYRGFDAPEAHLEPEPLPAGRHRPASTPRVLTLPLSVRGARVSVSLKAIGTLVVVVALALVVFAVRVARAQEAAAPVAVSVASGGTVVGRTIPSSFRSTASAGSSGSAASGPPATTGSAGAPRVVVHVVGQVGRPGVLTLPAGSRVVDAVRQAGGALPSADLAAVNLARTVVDGEQVVVPRPGEAVPSGSAPTGAAGGGSSSIATGDAVVDLNTADASALDGLPGVGPVLARRILDWRAQHGRFTNVEELGEVSGIGDKLLDQLRPRVRAG